jgi:thioredoxin reductase/ferredoxin
MCHPAHGDARGVTFTSAAGDFVLWSPEGSATGKLAHVTPAGATVPLVPVAVCASCHDAASPRDPIVSCVRSQHTVSFCFDEHQRVDGPQASARWVVWESAREAATASRAIPGVRASPAPRLPQPWTWLAVGLSAAGGTLGGLSTLRRLRRKTTAGPSAPIVPAARVRLPQINVSTCLGCYACVDACPFDVLEIQRYVAVVARPSDCCGVVLCQQVCPNGSLQIAEGAPIETLPHVDAHLESLDTPGIFLAGDLSGLPLIKNAIHQGRRVTDRIHATLGRKERSSKDGECDLVIVGAGPAGLSAALRAKELGLSYVVFEQGTVASSVRSFPREKLVFDQPLDLPVEGELWLRESTKEELLAQWMRIVRARKLAVREGRRVVDVARSDDGRFVVRAERASRLDVSTNVGVQKSAPTETARALRVVLAVGRRGTPRALSIPIAPDVEQKVHSSLADARSFAHKRVLVVGLGDSAMEAAIALARQPGTTVTVSYRGATYTRGKSRNIAELKSLAARGRVRILFESRLERVDPDVVHLATPGGPETLPNDAVLVLIGGLPSWDLMERAGVRRVAQVVENASHSDV